MVPPQLIRFVATALLLFAGLDLGVPSLCSAESVPDFNCQEAAELAPGCPEAPQHDEHPPGEEDCFCCCSHVKPQRFARVVEEPHILPEVPATLEHPIPDTEPHHIFHPPKI